ncbi:flagellar hook-associated protein FlgK [Terrabacter aerolatus]|uniref:Flagellar hook-associated protein 1 n=1 Tax=Terrabacter aerolatus TaxID=422442 RepID=A0A512CWG5_9MICO|nr:flagellar hook-associated protein FlgK [Terrabacter aerolatus]GEO28340.1 flagellar hook-associated protein FlgK [Terrabacter aerolatus]
MSTFGALGTAWRGLSAAQQAMDLAGHNVANAGTDGYTRQRIEQSSVGAPAPMGLGVTGPQVGQGVSVDRIARLGDALLDATVRGTASSAGYNAKRAAAYDGIEATLREPGSDGLSARLQAFWSAWHDVANRPGDTGAAGALLSAAGTVVSTLSSGRAALETQWDDTAADARGMVASLNDTAAQVAALNTQIRGALARGSSANELIDTRARLTQSISAASGATVRDEADGTVTVYLGGNALVRGETARQVTLTGAATMAGAAASPVRLEWADQPGHEVGLEGGSVAGALSVLAPAAGGAGGAIAEAAASYDAVAQTLAATVNAVHRAGSTTSGATGLDFFRLDPSQPAARGLSVVPTGAAGIATGAVGAGALDGSTADAIARLATGPGSADARWAGFVTSTGSAARAVTQQSGIADAAAAGARQAQLSGASVSLDEESVNLVAAQHAYQAAARVLTAVDEALDTLINRTGMVGR